MKTFYFIALLLAVDGGRLHAQSNTYATPRPTRSQTVITSTVVFFSNATRQIIYSGGVRVDDPQMQLTCEKLTADLPQNGGHINHLVALTNVVMDSVDDKGQTNHATSDMAVYDYNVVNGATNETVTLTGHAVAENAQVILYGEPIIYNRATGSLTATNQHMIIRQSLTSTLTKTNSLAAKTNSPVEIKDVPMTKTNFPPGTIQNIDKMAIPPAQP